jgi:hypothetical protein
MSLRRNRKRRSLPQRALALWAGWKLARPAKYVVLALAALSIVAAIRRRRSSDDELPPYGPPNESVPSHESLAPSQDAAAQTS